jgi:capsular polysaccharide biosynthesis protein
VTGNAIEAGVNRRGPKRNPISRDLQVELPPTLESAPDGDFVYIGDVHAHFGHFITTTLSRFWYLLQAPERSSLKLLYHGLANRNARQAPERQFEKPYIAQIIRAFNLTPQNFVSLDKPTLIRGRVTIPWPSFEENHQAHEIFVTCARTIGSRILDCAPEPSDEPIYLSKSRMKSGIRTFLNGAAIEDELALHGVKIIYPEQYSFKEQLMVMARHSRILGSAGSAFHTAAFVGGGKKLIGLNPTKILSSNFLIVDKVAGNEAVYIHPLEARNVADVRFRRAFAVRYPKKIARELLQLL